VIDTSLFSGKINQALMLSLYTPYYLVFEQSDSTVFEQSDTTAYVTVDIVNNSTIPFAIYLQDSEKDILDLYLPVGHKIKIKRNRNTLSMVLLQAIIPIIPQVNKSSPVYISNSFDYPAHEIQFELQNSILYIDEWTKDDDDFIMEIYSIQDKNGTSVPALRFLNANFSLYQ
jgi:hypothetical protein